MDTAEIIQLIGVSTVAVTTLIAITAVAVRAVFGPVLKARRLAAEKQAAPDTTRLEARMDVFEDELRQLAQSVERVASAAEFDAQLRSGAAPPPRLPDAQQQSS